MAGQWQGLYQGRSSCCELPGGLGCSRTCSHVIAAAVDMAAGRRVRKGGGRDWRGVLGYARLRPFSNHPGHRHSMRFLCRLRSDVHCTVLLAAATYDQHQAPPSQTLPLLVMPAGFWRGTNQAPCTSWWCLLPRRQDAHPVGCETRAAAATHYTCAITARSRCRCGFVCKALFLFVFTRHHHLHPS